MKKGQYIRLFISNSVSQTGVPIAASTNMTLHVSAQTENSSTKDDEGDFDVYEVTGLSFDIQSEALVTDSANGSIENNLTTLEATLDDTPLNFSIEMTEGDNNREPAEANPICSGQVKLTSLQVTAANRQNSTLSATFNGFGELTVGGTTAVSNAPSNSPAPESETIAPEEEGNDEG